MASLGIILIELKDTSIEMDPGGDEQKKRDDDKAEHSQDEKGSQDEDSSDEGVRNRKGGASGDKKDIHKTSPKAEGKKKK
ncbi:hypothetical protein Tcan_11225 [Toxocara canis]|uniref:Uncharacterized protein n=1 Tax=Toxocara canis TaxID=6265 RepID=A0A0B2V5I8_TOXCA|nr:hypothetical protein Tcan_11225 [Toxocara canis]